MTPTRNRAIIAIILAILVFYPALQGIRLLVAVTELKQLFSSVAQARMSNPAEYKTQFSKLEENLSLISDVTNDPLLTPIGFIPGISNEWHALGTATPKLSLLASAANQTYGSSSHLLGGKGSLKVNTNSLRRFAFEFHRLTETTRVASQAVREVTGTKLNFGLGQQLKLVGRKLTMLQTGTSHLDPLVQITALMLSDSKPHRWFVASQNLAEARGTGGLIGSYLVLESAEGSIRLVDSGSDRDLAARLPIPKGAQSNTYLSQWGIERGLWTDMNASRDLPATAKTILSAWKVAHKAPLSGVLFIGQGTMSHLLALVGPVKVDGHTLDYRNAGDYLAKEIYSDFQQVENKNRFVQDFSRALLSRLELGKFDLASLWASVLTTKSGDFPMMWTVNPAKEQKIAKLGLDGAVTTSYGHRVWLAINNAGGNKLDAYLKLRAAYRLEKCGFKTSNGLPGVQATATITISNQAPLEKLPDYVWPLMTTNGKVADSRNAMHQLVSVYAPVGSDDRSFKVDGQEAFAQFNTERDHPRYSVKVAIPAGKTTTLRFTWIEPLADDFGRRLSQRLWMKTAPSFQKVIVSLRQDDICHF